MDFFEQQDLAKRNTSYLVFLFAMAVLCIIVLAYAVVAGALTMGLKDTSPWDPMMLAVVGGGTCLVVMAASLYKISQLGRGGCVVAEMLGGRLIQPNSTDEDERKVLNVVEEMSIASGTPVPPVYLLDEDAINAFAAGHSPEDAVIGVTRGCIQGLTRDQLQGVMAHEFSHLLNGDMRLNLRLIGFVHGILVIGLIGYGILRMTFYGAGGRSRRSSNKEGGNGLPLLAIAVGLIVVGFAGTFFGNLIKAAVSRQREFLADAAAVQFTRNPEGIGGALKRIGGSRSSSFLHAPAAAEASHLFFAMALDSGIASWFRTHPPLEERIRRVDPSWDGKFERPPEREAPPQTNTATSPEMDVSQMVMGAAVLAHAVQHIGQPTPAHVAKAGAMLKRMPEALHNAARDPYGARAVVYALLIDTQDDIRKLQLERITQHADPGVETLVHQLLDDTVTLNVDLRLPLLDLCTPALAELSADQYRQFKANVAELIRADDKVDVFEWVLQRMILRHLEPRFCGVKLPRTEFHRLDDIREPVRILLSTLARAGAADLPAAAHAYETGLQHLQITGLELASADSCTLGALNTTLEQLDKAAMKVKRSILEGCVACIGADDRVAPREAELLRGMADSLRCPMPPLLT